MISLGFTFFFTSLKPAILTWVCRLENNTNTIIIQLHKTNAVLHARKCIGINLIYKIAN